MVTKARQFISDSETRSHDVLIESSRSSTISYILELPKRRKTRRVFRVRSGIRVWIRNLCLGLVFVFAITPFVAPSYRHPPWHYEALRQRCTGPTRREGCANVQHEKVFISASLYDNTGDLAAGEWGARLLELIDIIGPEDVFLSVYENDSGPLGKAALDSLRSRLKCRHRLVFDAQVPLDGFPTIKMPDGTDHVKRLAYLSEMRNRALRPLDDMDEQELGTRAFNKVLFLNDVLFHPTDAANLLFSTNVDARGHTQYLAACGLDFHNPLELYDVYAQRDAEGFSNGFAVFPFFSNAGQGISRAAMLRETDAVPVRSCWGGMSAMRAEFLQAKGPQTLERKAEQVISTRPLDPNNPNNITTPIRFRYEPEVFVDGCECCLIMADVTEAARKSGSPDRGVFVNPYVRTAYSLQTLSLLPWIQLWERLLILPQLLVTRLGNLPTHSPHREVRQSETFDEEVWINDGNGRSGQWQMVERVGRNGMFCMVREMQIIKPGDRGSGVNWENTVVPPGQAFYFPT